MRLETTTLPPWSLRCASILTHQTPIRDPPRGRCRRDQTCAAALPRKSRGHHLLARCAHLLPSTCRISAVTRTRPPSLTASKAFLTGAPIATASCVSSACAQTSHSAWNVSSAPYSIASVCCSSTTLLASVANRMSPKPISVVARTASNPRSSRGLAWPADELRPASAVARDPLHPRAMFASPAMFASGLLISWLAPYASSLSDSSFSCSSRCWNSAS